MNWTEVKCYRHKPIKSIKDFFKFDIFIDLPTRYNVNENYLYFLDIIPDYILYDSKAQLYKNILSNDKFLKKCKKANKIFLSLNLNKMPFNIHLELILIDNFFYFIDYDDQIINRELKLKKILKN